MDRTVFSFRFPLSWRRVAVLLAGAVLVAGCGKQARPELAVGRPFPPLALGASPADALAAPALQRKMLVLNVWATWCPPCRREMPALERLSKTLDPTRFAVVGVSTDHDERLAAEFLLQNSITFANFFDQGGAFARRWGLKAYPETFLIAPDGTLLERIVGYREWDSPDIVAELEAHFRRHQPDAR